MKKLSWIDFYNEFCLNDYIYDLKYGDDVYTVGSEIRGMKSKRKYFFSTQHTRNAKTINIEFDSPQALLERVKISGHRLQEIWDDIYLE